MFKIMIVATNPTDTYALNYGKEVKIIEKTLEDSDLRGKYKLEKLLATEVEDFRNQMLKFNPEIVHFIGHGQAEGLIFENSSGQTQVVEAEPLAGLFEIFKNVVKCVTLNACESELTAQAISQHIPYVIGMRRKISDQASLQFAAGFYAALGAGRDFEIAHKIGRNSIRLGGYDEADTPVLYFNEQALGNTEAAPDPSIKIFVSYADEDRRLKQKLIQHLAPLSMINLIKVSSRDDITAAEDEKEEIEARINAADIILLLISSDYVYSFSSEIEQAMARRAAGKARVIPILLHPYNFNGLSFAGLKALPRNEKAVTDRSWNSRDEALTEVVEGIKQVALKIKENRANQIQ